MESMEVKKMGDDLLLHAIVHGNTQDAIALLEDRECEVNGRNINGHTPLFVILSLYPSILTPFS